MFQDSGVNSQSTHQHWKQHNLRINPDGFVPQDAAGLNSSYCWTPTAKGTCHRRFLLLPENTTRHRFMIRHRLPERWVLVSFSLNYKFTPTDIQINNGSTYTHFTALMFKYNKKKKKLGQRIQILGSGPPVVSIMVISLWVNCEL